MKNVVSSSAEDDLLKKGMCAIREMMVNKKKDEDRNIDTN